MNALFVNGYGEQQCGVVQYGKALYDCLKDSSQFRWTYCEPATVGELRTFTSMPGPDRVIYNYQSGQGGYLLDAPLPWIRCPQVLVFHDCQINDRFDAFLFSDPSAISSGKWNHIGRPIPQYKPTGNVSEQSYLRRPVIGVHGFIGAFADQLVHRAMQEFETCTIRLSLPFARYGDSDGASAISMAERCKSMVSGRDIDLCVSHEFLPQNDLIEWLHFNDLNCYVRPPEMNWRGVSSAPDCALAARRPMAVNRCNSFRHLHNLSPSIMVEENSLMEIIGNGLSPLVKLYADWSPEIIRDQVESVLMKLE